MSEPDKIWISLRMTSTQVILSTPAILAQVGKASLLEKGWVNIKGTYIGGYGGKSLSFLIVRLLVSYLLNSCANLQ